MHGASSQTAWVNHDLGRLCLSFLAVKWGDIGNGACLKVVGRDKQLIQRHVSLMMSGT